MKRSPMTRHAPLRAAAPPKAEAVPLRMRKCPANKGGCGAMFKPARPGQIACGLECAAPVGAWIKASKVKTAKAEDTRKTRAALEAMKTRSDYLKEAQVAFNRYIRLRDAGRPCICCGKTLYAGGVGGGIDAGHYRSVGSAPHLRFDEDNCHAQSKQCNRFGAGRAVDYRLGLIERIGLAKVEFLEAQQGSPKWTREELRAIRDFYRGRCSAKWVLEVTAA